MRHGNSGRKFDRNSSHRRAMLRNLTANLVLHERIETTDAKAKELRRIAERLLYGMIGLHSGERTPNGCLELNAALACSTITEPIRQQLLRNRERFRLDLRDRFEETVATALLPPGMTSDDAASLVISLIQGLAVQAKAGNPQETARRVVHAALLSWPEPDNTLA